MTPEPQLQSMDEIKAAIAARQKQDIAVEAEQATLAYQFVRPFSTAADGLIEFVQNPEGRFMLGIHDLDVMTRGFGKGELAYITGRAHSGKTQVVMNAINSQRDARILFFTPDEVAELILAKLVSLRHGLNSEYVEERIKAKDMEMVELVRRTAAVDFRNLVVIDDSLTPGQMATALEEARDFWGQDADAVVIDFLELIPGGDGDANGVASKSQELKRWTKNAHVPVICLHQASRSSGNRGQSAGMGAMRYGGETEAIFVLEVFRQREDESLDDWERDKLRNTISILLDKNKRPPCKTGQVDLFLDPDTGFIRPLRNGDMAPSIPDHLRAAVAPRAS